MSDRSFLIVWPFRSAIFARWSYYKVSILGEVDVCVFNHSTLFNQSQVLSQDILRQYPVRSRTPSPYNSDRHPTRRIPVCL